MDDRKIEKFLVDLGLDNFEAAIYLALAKNGMLTTLELSRKTGIDRTKVYRRLEHLKSIGVVEEVIDENKKRAKAVEVDRLEYLLKTKEENVKNLKLRFRDVKLLLSGKVGLSEPGTKVLFYRGKRGIRQMIWNVLRLKKVGYGYTYRDMSEVIGETFYDKWDREFRRRGLLFKHIYSDTYLESRKKLGREFPPDEKKYFPSKYISPKILDIDHQFDIYNDVISIYNWYEGEVFGVEIYNKKVAKMQRQIFEILWGIAKGRSN